MRPSCFQRKVCVALLSIAIGSAAGPAWAAISAPKRLAIYYGYPSLVNGAGGNIAQAVASFAAFDVVVLGDGLEHAAHGDHANTTQIVAQLTGAGVEVYGYVDMGVFTQNLPIPTAQQYVDEWAAMGVTGIFWDDAGFDYGVDRTRQTTLIGYTHGQGLVAFVNAWEPDDIYATVGMVPTPLAANDWYLAESHPVANGALVDLADWWSKSNDLANYRTLTNTRVAAIATGDDGPLGWPNAAAYRQSLWAAYLFAWDGFGFTNANYSAGGAGANRLRALPPVATNAGGSYTGVPTMTGPGAFERSTDLGTIEVWGTTGSGGGTFVGGVCNTAALGTAIWPNCTNVAPPQSSPFGPRQKASESYRYDFHRGVDIPQALGQPVYATMDGIARLAGSDPGYSDQVIQLRHRGASPYLFSNVLHMDSVIVNAGDLITVGDLVGYSGEGESGFDHMHFELRDGCANQNCNRNPWGYLPYADVPPVTPSLGGANLGASSSNVVLDVATPDDQLDFDGVSLTWGGAYNLGLDAVNATTDPNFPEGLDHPVIDLGGGVKACIFPGQFNLASTQATYRFAFTGLPAANSGAASGSDVNASSAATPLAPSLPALSIDPAVVPIAGVPGQVVVLHHRIANTGGAPLNVTLTAHSAQKNAVVLSHPALALAPGASQEITVQVTLSPSFPAGVGDCVLLEASTGGQSLVSVGQIQTSSCPTAPAGGCVSAGRVALATKYDAGGKRGKLAWKWGKSASAVDAGDLGDATTGGSTYRLCVYDHVGNVPQLVFGADVPSGGTCGSASCWKPVAGGFVYKDRAGARGGVVTVKMKAGDVGKAKFALKAKGSNLSLPVPVGATYLHADSSVLVQFASTATGSCWQGTFAAPMDVKKNTATLFKAKHRDP